MNRRHFLSTVALGAPVLASQASRNRPNVLFIAVDDLNDWIGCLGGNPDVRTPNFDRLAQRGVLFTNAHCAAPLCNPSRAALMTGIRPSTSGIYDNGQPMRRSPVLRDAVSLTQHFMANGYRAIGGGKIFHGAYPDRQSWDDYFPSQTRNKPNDPVPVKLPAHGIPDTGHFDWGPVSVPDSAMGDTQVVEWAAKQLEKRQAKPLFLACGIFRPHLPWYVPKKYFDLYPLEKITLPKVNGDDLDDVPPIGRKFARPQGDHKTVTEHHQWRQAVQAYLASISFADASLGHLLDAFDASPYARDTTVVLWSDHGWHLGEKLHWRKFTLWEEATHNVLMMVAPDVTKPGGRCPRAVNLLDIYPTLADLCGLPGRKELEGQSLRALLKDPGAAWERPALTTFHRNNHSVRGERWRYIRYTDGTEELYDHRTDPLEWKNLAGKAEYKEVKAGLARWLPTVNAPESVHERGVNEGLP
ncbi:MAG: sulfatase [Acidobacteria bacterium]|nr:sulfatase [Acidobacteriota bacterium]MBI3281726.1 sulfatase [Acidobacteriota bacterium]